MAELQLPSPERAFGRTSEAQLDSFGGAGEQYTVEELLGEGSYGSVYRCVRVRDGQCFAVKVIDPRRIAFATDAEERTKEVELMAAKEVETLRKVAGHAGIVSLEAALCSAATRQIFIVTEFLAGGHLFSHLVCRAEPLPELEASHVVAQLADALAFCHAKGIVHRDVKLENVLVSSVDVQLVEKADAWRTQELFTVKVCDFGLAKALTAHAAQTPVGTPNYSAPEVLPGANFYDAYKADAYSFGVLIFVMLCLGFPSKEGECSYQEHSRWSGLSKQARSLLDGLLTRDPQRRLSVAEAKKHPWVKLISPTSGKQSSPREDATCRYRRPRSESKANAFQEVSAASLQPSQSPKALPHMQDPASAGILSLNRSIVELQHERGMACWALAAVGDLKIVEGISCWDQLRKNIQLTDKRLAEAKQMLAELFQSDHGTNNAWGKSAKLHPVIAVDAVDDDLREARDLVLRQESQSMPGHLSSYDSFFAAYNRACGLLIDVVARSMKRLRADNPEIRKAVQRFCLCSAAAEQLARERGFALLARHCAPHAAKQQTCKSSEDDAWPGQLLPRENLRRLAEILGARKVLLGTASSGARQTGDVVASSTGLLGALIGDEGEPPLLSAADIARLEFIEERMLDPMSGPRPPAEEWWGVLTQLVKQIHSRIAIALVEGMRRPACGVDLGNHFKQVAEPSQQQQQQQQQLAALPTSCRAGVRRLLEAMLEQL
eukprot:TRINITY_DN14261_c0_g1_i1.p1 TRINITY_DN14261_c0_g1~~TRINITY_DN14261_c0_g1_i1.p1  ORF type:complete len:720 (-),score=159.26 TRINITY_DN14261_c0_g1_i1:42-2201(-)